MGFCRFGQIALWHFVVWESNRCGIFACGQPSYYLSGSPRFRYGVDMVDPNDAKMARHTVDDHNDSVRAVLKVLLT